MKSIGGCLCILLLLLLLLSPHGEGQTVTTENPETSSMTISGSTSTEMKTTHNRIRGSTDRTHENLGKLSTPAIGEDGVMRGKDGRAKSLTLWFSLGVVGFLMVIAMMIGCLLYRKVKRDKEVIEVHAENIRRISQAQVEYQVNKQMKNFNKEHERRRSTCQVAEQLISDAEDHLQNVQKRIKSVSQMSLAKRQSIMSQMEIRRQSRLSAAVLPPIQTPPSAPIKEDG